MVKFKKEISQHGIKGKALKVDRARLLSPHDAEHRSRALRACLHLCRGNDAPHFRCGTGSLTKQWPSGCPGHVDPFPLHGTGLSGLPRWLSGWSGGTRLRAHPGLPVACPAPPRGWLLPSRREAPGHGRAPCQSHRTAVLLFWPIW